MKLNVWIAAVGLFVLSVMVTLRVMDPFFIETARLKGLDYYQRKQAKIGRAHV